MSKDLFRVSFLVDDKNLGQVLRACAGKIYDLKADPVNLPPTVTNGSGERQKHTPASESVALLSAELDKLGQHEVRNRDIKAIVSRLGWATGSTSHYMRMLMQHHVLKRGRKPAGEKGHIYHWSGK